MKPTYPRSESRGSRTPAAVLLALLTLVQPLSPLFVGAAQAQGGARRPASGGRAEQPADKGTGPGGGDVQKSPDPVTPSVVTAAQLKVTLDDGVAAGQFKRPGETITYTATIQNTNPTDAATNVKFLNDLTANANLTFVNGSVQTQPIARADAFDVLGNVRIQVPDGASDLLANDTDPDGTALRITAFDATSARGGEVTVDTTTGAFTYNPPAGYDGADSFTYTVKDAGPDNTPGNSDDATDTATVTLTVANMIWFVDNTNHAATPCVSRAAGCGRLTNPFTDLQEFQNAQNGSATNNGDTVDPEAGDNIFLYTGTANYSGPFTLKNTQKLIGQGASDTLAAIAGVTPPAHSDALPSTNEPAGTNPTPPTITSAAGGILLANGNTLRGFNVGAVGSAAAQSKIQGTNFGTLTVGKTSEPDVSLSGAGRMLNLTTGSFAANSGFNSAASTSSADAAIFLSGITPPGGGSTLTFVGVTVAGGSAEGIEVTGSTADINFGAVNVSNGTNAIVLTNNTGGTRTFGSITVQNNSGDAFLHTGGGGATTVTGATAITNPGNRGIVIQGSTTLVDFANANITLSAGPGVLIGGAGQGNSGAVDFADLDIAPDPGGAGFFAQANTAAVTTTSGTITTTDNAAITAIGGNPSPLIPLSMALDSVSCSMAVGVSQFCVNVTDATGTLAMNGGSITGGGAAAFNVLRGNPTVGYAGTVSQANGQRVVSVEGTTGNGVTFTNTVTATGLSTGVRIVNANGNVSFSALNLGTAVARLTSTVVSISGGAGTYGLGTVAIFTDNQTAVSATDADGTINIAGGTVDATDGTALSIDGPGGLTNLGVTLASISATNAAGGGVIIQDASGSFSMTDGGSTEISVTNPAAGSTGTGLQVQNTSATFSFADVTITGTGNANGDDIGTGVLLSNNTGAITFDALSITPDSGERGLFATDNNAGTAAGAITVASGNVATTNDTAVEIAGASNTARTPLSVQLTTVSTAGGNVAPNGIKLVNTSAASGVGFRVLGNGGTCTQATPTCTGGQINNTASGAANGSADGNGIFMQNVDNARFTRIRVNDHVNGAIRGINVNVFVLDNSITHGTNGNEAGGPREGSLTFDGNLQSPAQGLVGNSAITNCDIRGGFSDQVYIDNSSGRLDLTVTNSQFHAGSATNGNNDNFAIESDTTADVFLSITGSTFGETDGESLDLTLVNTGDMHATITGNTFTGNNAPGNRLGQGLRMFGASWNGVARYNVSNNTITGVVGGGAIQMNKGSGTGDMQGTISANTIGIAAVANSGATQSSGIRVESRGAGGQHTALVSNNQVHQINNHGILLEVGEDASASHTGPAAALNATVTGNTIDTPGANAQHGIFLNAGLQGDAVVFDNNPVCADIGHPTTAALKNNVATAANETPPTIQDGFDVRARRRFAPRVELPGYTGGPHDSAALNSYFTGRNVLTSVSSTSLDDGTIATDGFFNTPGGAACAQPGAVTLPNAPVMNEVLGGGEQLAASQQPLTIPGLMIIQPPRTQAAGQMDMPVAPQPAVAQPVAQPKAQSEKSSAAQPSRGGEEKSKKGTGGKIGVTTPSAGQFEVNIGTLPANDSVTITFQVTIAPTLSPATANSVTNQGTVTADGPINKVSDDPQTTPPAAGDGNDATVTNIDKFEPAIDVVSSDTTTDQGDSVTFTATLGLGTAPGVPAPTGTVDFVDQTDANPANWEVLCNDVAISGTTAQCATTAVDAGTRTIAAVYSGDGRYDPATDTVTQTVTACLVNPVVTSTADDGSPGTLRHSITNACTGTTITFDITGAGPHTITLNSGSGELSITKDLTITGPTGESVIVSAGGAAIRVFNVTGGTVNISNLTVTGVNDVASDSGGGLRAGGGASTIVTVSGMLFTGNKVLGNGGGLGVVESATLNVVNTTVSGNTATNGGGIVKNAAVLNLVNATVTANNADGTPPDDGKGGGIFNIHAGIGSVNIRNSIVTGNTATTPGPDFANINGTGATTDLGNNLIGVDAGLGALASNGGPTQTHALLAGSAALDAGNNCVTTAGGCAAGPPADPVIAVSTDQRGFPRPRDAADADTTDTVDIGAFEAQASVAVFADASIAQDTSHTVTDFSVGDADSTLTVTATSDNTTLVPNNPANLAVNAGSSADKRTLVVTPAAGQTGTANITVTVTDTVSGTSMSDTFQLTVNALAVPTVTITADTPDPSNSGQAVTVSFTVTGSAGTPTGNVVITASGGAETCMASVATGQCMITLTAAGSRTLTATYSGDGTYSGGTGTEPHAVLPNVTISDATASEASQLATFTVHLDVPSTDTVTVNFTTADEPAGPGKAVAGQDYTGSSGNVVFDPGQTLKTIPVPVTNDGQTGEPDETFLVNLTGATNGNVAVSPADNQATGTITEANNAGAIVISEIRTSGPGGAGDQFVELYNNSDSPVTLNATDLSAGYSLAVTNGGCAADPVVVGIIANGTIIPARGHYLFVGSAYSLASSAAGNLTLSADMNADVNVALFSTSDLKSFSSQTRVDAVGFFDGVNGLSGNCDLLREGTPLNAAQGSTSQYSFFRRLTTGKPQDTGRSVDDFQIVSTTPSVAVGFNATPNLGAPGPENIASPIQRNDKIKASLIDPMAGTGSEPNSVRKFCSPMTPGVEECDANRSQFGTFSIRRRFTNNTGDNLTQLRFRIVNVTVGPAPAGTADLRAISSLQVTGVPLTGGGTVDVEGTTLEAPTQPLGGGYNSTLAVGTITMAAPLAPGASVNVQFLLGVQQPGAYSFFVNVEAGPPPVGVLTPAKGGALPAKEGVNKNGTAGRP